MEFLTLDADTAFVVAIDSLDGPEKLVVCGSEEDKHYIEEAMDQSDQSVDEIIAGAENVDVAAWFKQRKRQLEEDAELSLQETQGPWPGESDEKPGFTLAFDMLTGEVHKNLVGARVETDESWKILAHFKFGDWNECPNPEIHCAIWKYWQEKYGAKVVGVSNDVIEACLTKPPESEEAAMELAWEQYLYCSDIVDQGVETISNLGASLMNHSVWYFWWD